MHLFIDFRESTAPQNRQLTIWISNIEEQVDDSVGELTFPNKLINTFCEIPVDESGRLDEVPTDASH